MNYEQWCEENNAWFSRHDRFDGWGDPDRGDMPEYEPPKRRGDPMPGHWVAEDIPF